MNLNLPDDTISHMNHWTAALSRFSKSKDVSDSNRTLIAIRMTV